MTDFIGLYRIERNAENSINGEAFSYPDLLLPYENESEEDEAIRKLVLIRNAERLKREIKREQSPRSSDERYTSTMEVVRMSILVV